MIFLPSRQTVPPWVALSDPDVRRFVRAVEAADGQQLELPVRKLHHEFVTGCKADGIFDALKACCIMAGARTLSGALTPLVGPAPTNFNFVSGDYNRRTGLVGDGSTKYLDSNRNNNADPQNNSHQAIFASVAQSSPIVTAYIGAGAGLDNGATHIGVNIPSAQMFFRSRTSVSAANVNFTVGTTGFHGMSRNNSASFQFRFASSTQTATFASELPFNGNVLVFNRFSTSNFSNARLSFYSIGESLDLALLDSRVTALMNGLAAVLP